VTVIAVDARLDLPSLIPLPLLIVTDANPTPNTQSLDRILAQTPYVQTTTLKKRARFCENGALGMI
jgi:hypothetical protein